MVEWDLAGQDVYGCLVLLDLAAMRWRAALTADFVAYVPVSDASELLDPPLAQAMSGGINAPDSHEDDGREHRPDETSPRLAPGLHPPAAGRYSYDIADGPRRTDGLRRLRPCR